MRACTSWKKPRVGVLCIIIPDIGRDREWVKQTWPIRHPLNRPALQVCLFPLKALPLFKLLLWERFEKLVRFFWYYQKRRERNVKDNCFLLQIKLDSPAPTFFTRAGVEAGRDRADIYSGLIWIGPSQVNLPLSPPTRNRAYNTTFPL